MAYVKQTWNNGASGGTPLSAARLNHIEDGIGDVDPALATKADAAVVSATYERIGQKVYHLDTYNKFFLNAGAWVIGQPGGDMSTTLTASATAGASTMAVVSGAMCPNGSSLITNPGTAAQQIYVVTAGGGTTALTVTPNIVTTMANGATIGTLWTNESHLTISGYNAYSYWLVHALKNDGTLVIGDPGTRPITFLGNSWLYNMRVVNPIHINAIYPTATVVNASVTGNTSAQMIARFATDVPANSAYVVINEPGINDIYQDVPLVTQQANLEQLVRLCRGIGAVPIFTGLPPLQAKSTITLSYANQALAQVGDGWSFPGPNVSKVGALFPGAILPVAATVATSLGMGYRALSGNAAGTGNTGVGESALYNTTGSDNTAVGNLALNFNVSGNRHCAVGHQSSYLQTGGVDNVSVGDKACYNSLTGELNVGIGSSAMYGQTGNGSVGIGYQTMYATGSGGFNVGIGFQALRSVTSGNTNVAVGGSAGYKPLNTVSNATTTATGQTIVGYQSGQSSATQVNDITAVGSYVVAGAAKATALGSLSAANHAGSVALGSDTVTTAIGQVMVGPRDVEHTDATKGVVLKSPDGTRYRVTVANGGTLVVTAA